MLFSSYSLIGNFLKHFENIVMTSWLFLASSILSTLATASPISKNFSSYSSGYCLHLLIAFTLQFLFSREIPKVWLYLLCCLTFIEGKDSIFIIIHHGSHGYCNLFWICLYVFTWLKNFLFEFLNFLCFNCCAFHCPSHTWGTSAEHCISLVSTTVGLWCSTGGYFQWLFYPFQPDFVIGCLTFLSETCDCQSWDDYLNVSLWYRCEDR